MLKLKEEVITFKSDVRLAEALRQLPNRSEFIRSAILSALENSCPLCQGSGVLTLEQKRHWDAFAKRHTVEQCDDCDATYLTCDKSSATSHCLEEDK